MADDDLAEEPADGEDAQVLDEEIGDKPVAPAAKTAGAREDHDPRSRPEQ